MIRILSQGNLSFASATPSVPVVRPPSVPPKSPKLEASLGGLNPSMVFGSHYTMDGRGRPRMHNSPPVPERREVKDLAGYDCGAPVLAPLATTAATVPTTMAVPQVSYPLHHTIHAQYLSSPIRMSSPVSSGDVYYSRPSSFKPTTTVLQPTITSNEVKPSFLSRSLLPEQPFSQGRFANDKSSNNANYCGFIPLEVVSQEGSALSETTTVLVTMVDIHNPKSKRSFYFAKVHTGGLRVETAACHQTVGVEVEIGTVLVVMVYECPDPVFNAELAQCLGQVRIPISLLAERYWTGIFQQWFNLDASHDRGGHRAGEGLANDFEHACADAVLDIYQPKICLSIVGSTFDRAEVDAAADAYAPKTSAILRGRVESALKAPPTQDVALIASHKQQAAYIDALHEEVRRLNGHGGGYPSNNGTGVMLAPKTTA